MDSDIEVVSATDCSMGACLGGSWLLPERMHAFQGKPFSVDQVTVL